MSAGPTGLPAHAIRITDIDDPRIAVFRHVKERDRVGREGVFIAEGATVLTVLLTRSRLDVLGVLIEENRAARLSVLSAPRAQPLYVAPQSVLDAIAGFSIHRGILAAGRIPPSAPLAPVLAPPVVRLPVLVTLSNHDNVGGIYRNAAAFGAGAVVVSEGTADPFYRKAIRVGVGAPLVVPTVRAPSAADLVNALLAENVTVFALSPSAPAVLGKVDLPARAAFLLGTEGEGLPAALMANATPLAIAMTTMDSLNVSVSAALVLHAHARAHPGSRASCVQTDAV